MNTDGYVTSDPNNRSIIVFRSFHSERKIQVIRLLRAFRPGTSLKDAKDAVDALANGTGTVGGYLTQFERIAFEAAGFDTIESSARSFNLTPVV